MLAFEALQLFHERVEFDVGYLGVAENVVALFVVPNEPAEFSDAFSGIHSS
jgi:hypothetical protein